MKANPKLIEQLLEESGVGFNNVKAHEEFKANLDKHGYNEAKINEFLAIHARMKEKYQEFERLSGKQLEVSNSKDKLYSEELGHYSFFRQMIANTYTGDEYKGLRSQLGLDRRIKTRFEGFIEQATQLYEGALNNQEALKAKGNLTAEITVEKLQERKNALLELKKLNEDQENAKGNAIVARRNRDEAYRELRIAWGNFKISCRTLFKDKEEYLKILGISPRRKPEPEEEPATPAPGTSPVVTPPVVTPTAVTPLPLSTSSSTPAITPGTTDTTNS